MTDRTERITANGHKVVTFFPRRYTKRTLFNRVLKELKAKEIKIDYFRVVVLAQFKELYKPDFKHTGKLYTYRWVNVYYPKIKLGAYFKSLNIHSVNRGVYFSDILHDLDNKYRDAILNKMIGKYDKFKRKIIENGTYIQNVYNSKEEKFENVTKIRYEEVWENDDGSYLKSIWRNPDKLGHYIDKLNQNIQKVFIHYEKNYEGKLVVVTSEYYLKQLANEMKSFHTYANRMYEAKPKDFHAIKLRFCEGTMDLTKYKTPFYSPMNLKYWDAKGNTSNLGLKAIYPYKWEDYSDHKSGWVFGGIKVDTLHWLCKMNKMPNYKAKMKYGELANWWYKGLM